jgi:fructoselysine 6-kinase
MARILGIGDNTVDIYVDQGVQFPGGNAVNIAVLTKRLGAETSYLGCIGTDFLGEMIRDGLTAEGVDVSHLRIIEGPNAWSRIRHVGNDRYFDGSHPSMRGDYRLGPEDFRFIAGFDLAHSSVYSRLESELERIGTAAPLLSFDYSSEYNEAYIAKTAPYIDIAFLSDSKGSDDDCLALAKLVAARGTGLVAITRGARGSLGFDGTQFQTQPIANAKAEIVDTLGAGDGFIAAFLMAHLNQASIADALMRGTEYAAHVCSYRGAFGHETPLRPGQPGLTKPLEKKLEIPAQR